MAKSKNRGCEVKGGAGGIRSERWAEGYSFSAGDWNIWRECGMRMELGSHGSGLERYREYLLLLVRIQLGDQFRGKIDASDVVQQALLEAHQKSDQFAGEESQFLPWLRKLLACTLADAIRTLTRAKRDPARERSLEAAIDESSVRLGTVLAADQTSPSQHAVRNEDLARLAEAIATLPEAQRVALVLRYGQGAPVAEIARQLGRTPVAVAGLLKRGSQQLRLLLRENE